MFKTALLEIKVEELPSSLVEEALTQLREKGEELFTSSNLDYEKITVSGSCRRLILQAEKVSLKQKERIEKETGPPERIIVNERGELTKEGKAYLKAKGIKRENLGVEKLKKGNYVYIKRKTVGKKSKDILPLLFPELITSLSFSKSMRWGKGDFAFARPIRSILALLGEEIIEFEVAGIRSGRETRGHPYLSPFLISIDNSHKYSSILREKWVIINPAERREIIIKQMQEIVSQLNKDRKRQRVLDDKELLNDIVSSVEYPTMFLGEFDPHFLSLPSPVLKACLRDYQQHFSVVEKETFEPYFIGVRDGNREYLGEVIKGNQRVLNARLSDAKFFFEEDKKIPLEKRVPLLKEIVVQEKLGSYYDKTLRLVKLGERIATSLGIDEKVRGILKEAAYLCKTDLTTQMVKEFPSLEGIMGKEYALYFKKDAQVAQAIYEHKIPRSNEKNFPRTPAGAILALTNKLDTLVGSFWAGFIPSGSEDPWGLRRQAQGIVEIILDREWEVSLDYLIKESLKLYQGKEGTEQEKIILKVKGFLRARMVNILKDKGIRTDQIKAILRVDDTQPTIIIKRGEALLEAASREEFKEEVIAIVRLLNMLKQAQRRNLRIPQKLKEELLIEKEERKLYQELEKIETKVKELLEKQRYLEAYQTVSTLKESIHNFFQEVLVMNEDACLRANRLCLLKRTGKLFSSIADFTELQVK